MNKKIFAVLLIITSLVPLGCTSQTPAGVPQAETAPLSWLLKFVPNGPGNQLAYSDILTLSAYRNKDIPSIQTPDEEILLGA